MWPVNSCVYTIDILSIDCAVNYVVQPRTISDWTNNFCCSFVNKSIM